MDSEFKLQLRRTDRRMTGHLHFKYYAQADLPSLRRYDRTESYKKFCEVRTWCWEQWGASCEVDLDPTYNPHWGWMVDDYRFRIYLADKNEATLTQLKWS